MRNRGYLDFTDFKRFVKSLKARPELDRLFKKITGGEPAMTFPMFERFMRDSQKVRPASRLCFFSYGAERRACPP